MHLSSQCCPVYVSVISIESSHKFQKARGGKRERERERELLRSRSSSLVLPGLPHLEAAEALAGFMHLIALMPSAKMLAYQRERERESQRERTDVCETHTGIYRFIQTHTYIDNVCA